MTVTAGSEVSEETRLRALALLSGWHSLKREETKPEEGKETGKITILQEDGSLTPEVEDMIRRSLLEDEEGATEPLYAQTGMVRDHQGNLVEPEQKTSQNRSEGRARDMEELSEEELAEKKAAALRMLTGWGC